MQLFSNNTFMTIIKCMILLISSIIINKVIEKIFEKNKATNVIYMKFFKNVLKSIVYIIAFASMLGQIPGFSKFTNTILAGSGIFAAVIGLAAQESFSNILSGLFISLFKPFDIGDRIRLVGDDTAGFVEDITLRHTIIRTYMNVRIIIPNSIIGSAKIENSSYSKGASYPIDVTIAYENIEKIEQAMQIMEDVVTSHPLFYDTRTKEAIDRGDKPVKVLCNSLESSGVNLRVLMWTEHISDNPVACSECRMEILKRFEKNNIEIPYNKIVIYDTNTKL